MSTFLQEPVFLAEPIEKCLFDDGFDGFSCLIRSSPPAGNGFQLCWEGVLGMQLIDGKPDVSVSLFLYSRNHRLGMMNHTDGSYLEIVYEGSLENGGQWTTLEWLEDGFGEFLAYDSYGGQ
ncbi:hypothetical protein ABZ801_13385 [Actinomadura sp. NPDC047616]|uniref:hypothetical protein n=1 Tax=Actinomadura sp. NPDC047616 TaxID=3155914 RepID=UPI0033D18AD0